MTPEEESKIIGDADEIISKGHSLLTDVYYARKQRGHVDEGAALTQAIALICDALNILRDEGESPAHPPSWARKPH